MQLFCIDTGYFKLDGGAMFGVVPKSIWNKLNPADENNLCTWAMRCLLIQLKNKRILIDTGIGTKQSENFLKHYHLHGDTSLFSSIENAGFKPEEITDVVLTHLHFDHVGGAVSKNELDELKLSFPNANYWVHSAHLQHALLPNAREKASFLEENIQPLIDSKKLKFIDQSQELWSDELSFIYVDGHTEKQILPLIKYKNHTILYAADLIPSAGHIPIAYVMGYDMRPLKTLQEKEELVNTAVKENWLLFFEHDPINELCSLQNTPKGVRMLATLTLKDL
jgi:glyoxylase-like metal-dependent hydrolase (beta-lactamase superfamily II)